VNHDGSIDTAMRLVEAAATAGANAVKFQSFMADELAVATAMQADYQRIRSPRKMTQSQMLEELELSREDFVALKNACDGYGIEFMSTGFDSETVRMLMEIGIKRIKVPSGELTHHRFLEYVSRCGLPVILSTGMSSLQEVRDGLDVLLSGSLTLENVTILHCTSAYPAPIEEANLNAITTLRQEFDTDVGYSDHTMGEVTAIAATALGAVVVEKHLTLNRNSAGPDHAASMEPDEFSKFIRALRSVPVALGNGVKIAQPSETDSLLNSRRSLVAARRILSGEIFDPENVVAKRPSVGLSPTLWDKVIGTRAKRDFDKDETIEI